MKTPYLILLLFLALNVYSQSKFSDGYQDGYKKGYCYEQGVGCIEPIPPIPPIPRVNENLNSYQDGYNRGFADGKESSSKSPTSRERYKTSSPEYVEDIIYQPNWEVLASAAAKKNRDFQATAAIREEKFYDYYAAALTAFSSKNYNEVIDLCKKALNTFYYNAEIFSMLGIGNYEIGNYELALPYLKRAAQLGSKDASPYITKTNAAIKAQKDKLKRDFKEFKKRRTFIVGVKGGVLNNENLTSPLGGIFLQGSNSMNFAMMAEVLYYQNMVKYYTFSDSKDGFVQVNMLLKHKLIKRLEILYGGGLNANVTNQADYFGTAAGGLQFYITHQLFVDGRYNHAFTENIPANNFMVSLGYNF